MRCDPVPWNTVCTALSSFHSLPCRRKQCTFSSFILTESDKRWVQTDIHQSATLYSRESKVMFRYLIFRRFPGNCFSTIHDLFDFFFCSYEYLICVLCALQCGTILFPKDYGYTEWIMFTGNVFFPAPWAVMFWLGCDGWWPYRGHVKHRGPAGFMCG